MAMRFKKIHHLTVEFCVKFPLKKPILHSLLHDSCDISFSHEMFFTSIIQYFLRNYLMCTGTCRVNVLMNFKQIL